MDIDIDLSYLECVGMKREKHFLENPVVLECGHSMCFNCVHNEKKNENTVRCGTCKEEKTVNFEMNHLNFWINKQIETCLGRLFDVVQQKCKSNISKLKCSYIKTKESIELQFENIKKTIKIKAESLKNEIDELCETICSDLELQKQQNFKKVDAIHVEACNCENEIENNQALKFVEKKTENLTNLQGKLNMLNQLNQELLDDQNKVHSSGSQKCIDMELIQYLDYNDKYKKRLIIPSKFEQVIPIDVGGLDLCVIPEDKLMVSDYIDKGITVFDKDIKPVKTVKEINGNSFTPFATATNGIDKIFISDHQIKKIFMTNLEFKLMGTFESNDVIDPRGLCYSNHLLYACDFTGKSIHVIEQDFTNKTSYKLDFKPWYIQVIDKIACIRHCNETCISFYKFPEFKLKYRYEGHNGFICIANSKFYEFYQPLFMFYCYNSDGTICFKQKIELSNNLTIYDSIIYFKDKFVLSANRLKKLILP